MRPTLPPDVTASSVAWGFLQQWGYQLGGVGSADWNLYVEPHVALLPGSAGDHAKETARAFMACDWCVRTSAPFWLNFLLDVGVDNPLTAALVTELAAGLSGLGAIVDSATLATAIPVVDDALARVRKVRGVFPYNPEYVRYLPTGGWIRRAALFQLQREGKTAEVIWGNRPYSDILPVGEYAIVGTIPAARACAGARDPSLPHQAVAENAAALPSCAIRSAFDRVTVFGAGPSSFPAVFNPAWDDQKASASALAGAMLAL